jgi:hypothetical protein
MRRRATGSALPVAGPAVQRAGARVPGVRSCNARIWSTVVKPDPSEPSAFRSLQNPDQAFRYVTFGRVILLHCKI